MFVKIMENYDEMIIMMYDEIFGIMFFIDDDSKYVVDKCMEILRYYIYKYVKYIIIK